MTEAWGRNPHIAVYIRPHEDLRVPRPIGNEVIEFWVELLLFLRLVWMVYRAEEHLDHPLCFSAVRVHRAVRPVREAEGDPDHSSREKRCGKRGERLQLACSCPDLSHFRVQDDHDSGTGTAHFLRLLQHPVMEYRVAPNGEHEVAKLPCLLQTISSDIVIDHKCYDFLQLVVSSTAESVNILAKYCTRVRAGITGTRRSRFDVSSIGSGGGLTGSAGAGGAVGAPRHVRRIIVIVLPVDVFIVHSKIQVAFFRCDGAGVVVELD